VQKSLIERNVLRPTRRPASEGRERQIVEDGQIPRRNCAKLSECRYCG